MLHAARYNDFLRQADWPLEQIFNPAVVLGMFTCKYACLRMYVNFLSFYIFLVLLLSRKINHPKGFGTKRRESKKRKEAQYNKPKKMAELERHDDQKHWVQAMLKRKLVLFMHTYLVTDWALWVLWKALYKCNWLWLLLLWKKIQGNRYTFIKMPSWDQWVLFPNLMKIYLSPYRTFQHHSHFVCSIFISTYILVAPPGETET